MRDLFYDFLSNPTGESYRAVADALFASEAYAPYSTNLRDIALLCQQERYEEVLAKGDEWLWGLILSPRFHLYRSIAFSKLGNETAEKMEDAVFRSCIEAMVSTGDGTAAAPYFVTGISDEYDLLQSLKKRSVGQRLHQEGDRAYDVHRIDDGSDVWFDITAVKRHLDAHFASGRA
jgi:hypothetical protein